MAIPQNVIDAEAPFGILLEPDRTDGSRLESFELGGIALNDASQGRLVHVWRAWLDVGDPLVGNDQSIKLAPISGSPVTTLVSGLGAVTDLSVAFDSNMQPVLAYVEDGLCKLRYFSLLANAFVIDPFPGCITPKCSTDDKRETQEGASDVLFSYVRAGNVYWRTQRDNYAIERLVGPVPNGFGLRRIGMNRGFRFQWELTRV